MVALTVLFSSLLFASFNTASPLPSCSYAVETSLGTAHGTWDSYGVVRYAVRYGTATRWAPSHVVQSWELPTGANDAAGMPLQCPQSGVSETSYSEDCLSVLLYVPQNLPRNSPTMMWIHGGSFIEGSATGAGLDGSHLASATNSIVAVVQYRLGALAFMAPNGPTNLGLKDIVTALKFLRKVVPAFGGDRERITVAGQSSGGTMIRALLAVPSVSSLFQSAIIQSDPIDYGFLSSSTQGALQTYFNSQLNCTSTDNRSLDALSIPSILSAQNSLLNDAMSIDPSTGQGEPIRPVHDGSYITTTLDSSSPFPPQSKPLLISTVADEAGPTIYGGFPSPVPQDEYSYILNLTLANDRTETLLASPYYQPTDPSDVRSSLEQVGTDYIWRCAAWTFARSWVQSGGNAYVGVYTVGATYPDNAGIPFCEQPGSVCHEDDIEIVFGTVAKANKAQSSLTSEMQARYGAFLRTGNPNTGGVPSWQQATTSDVHPLLLGGKGEAPVGACTPSFWGDAVQYDYQVYNI